MLGDQRLHRVGVLGDAAHRLPGLVFVEIGDGKAQDVVPEMFPDIPDKPLPDVGHQVVGQASGCRLQ